MFSILLAKVCFVGRDSPVNTKRVIKDTDTTIDLRMIELITLILENSSFAQNCKAVSKATRDKELTVVLFSQLYSHMLAVCG